MPPCQMSREDDPPCNGSASPPRGPAHRRVRRDRVRAPYLTLKIVWLVGGTLGVADRLMRETSMLVSMP